MRTDWRERIGERRNWLRGRGVHGWKEVVTEHLLKAVKEEKARAERNKPIEVVFAYGSQTANAAEICRIPARGDGKYKKDKMTMTTRIECFACNELDAIKGTAFYR